MATDNKTKKQISFDGDNTILLMRLKVDKLIERRDRYEEKARVASERLRGAETNLLNELARRRAEAEKAENPWILVSERKPSDGQVCLVIGEDKDRGEQYAKYVAAYDQFMTFYEFEDKYVSSVYKATRWRLVFSERNIPEDCKFVMTA